MRGFWPDERVDGNLWNLKNPLYEQVYNLFKRREKRFLEEADHTICLTQAAELEIHSWQHLGNNPVQITVIPCCADMDHFDPEKVTDEVKATWKAKLNITADDKIITYVGSIGTWYMPDEMLDFFKVLLEQDTKMRFLFITRDDPAIIMDMAMQKKIDPSKIIVQSGSRNDMPALISLSDYAIFFIKPAYSKIASSPTKQAEIMRLGIPLICNDLIGDTSHVVTKYNAGIVLKEFNNSGYMDAVNRLNSTSFDILAIQRGAIECYDLELGIARYDQVYRDIFLIKPDA
jgi:glycosyltransferase involved in cell wall biosynthesis